MFKSIEHKLILYLSLLIFAVAVSTVLIMQQEYVYLMLTALIFLFSIIKLSNHYNKFNKNILFLLNALENGDYSFNFSTSKVSRREEELNIMMNRIKEILMKTQREIVENEKFLGLIIESVSTGIIILNETNHIQNTNKATNELLGLPVFTHLNQLNILDESFPELFANIQVGETCQIQISNEREIIQVSLHASQIKMRNTRLKIITLNNIGNELEAQEMESWTRLIRVMTHEIMNSIAPITSLTETLLFSYKVAPNDEDLQANTIEALETISSTAKGLINFVDSYRKFTGVPKPQKSEFELYPILQHISQLVLAHDSDKNIDILINCNADFKLNADESQISQIIINLVKNAVEVLPSESGQIKINAFETDNQKTIEVKNNGKAIPSDILPNIFIPFFTTKVKGSGIGLSVSRYIMRLHGGNLKHHTKDEFTVFSMVFNI